jgi:hypothetical protein
MTARPSLSALTGLFTRYKKACLCGGHVRPSVRDLVAASKQFVEFPYNSVQVFFRGRRPLGRPRRRWEDNIKMDLQEVGRGHGLDSAGSG